MKKHAIWVREKNNNYDFSEYNHPSMFTLFMFLGDGIPLALFLKFLEDPARKEFSGNISELVKHENMVEITIDDYVLPNAFPLRVSVDNLIIILHEWKRLRELEVDKIEIILEGDNLSISGN